MKALILYRSYYGNTKQVAELIAQQLNASGHQSTVQDLRLKLPDLNRVDLIVIGAPTRMARVNRKAIGVLKQLRKKAFSGKPVAVFDTYGPVPTNPEELEKSKKWLYPGAAGIMQSTARGQGLKVYEKILRCEVKGLKGPLAENERANAAAFAKDLISSIGKKP